MVKQLDARAPCKGARAFGRLGCSTRDRIDPGKDYRSYRWTSNDIHDFGMLEAVAHCDIGLTVPREAVQRSVEAQEDP